MTRGRCFLGVRPSATVLQRDSSVAAACISAVNASVGNGEGRSVLLLDAVPSGALKVLHLCFLLMSCILFPVHSYFLRTLL